MSARDANWALNRAAGFAPPFCDQIWSDEERAAMRAGIRRGDRELRGALLYAALRLLGWATTTILTTAGLFAALFAAAGNLTLVGFFEQIGLLADHYVAAEPVRRASFDAQLIVAIIVVFVVTGFFRRRSLLDIFKMGESDGPRSND
jgi:hypothetical protein